MTISDIVLTETQTGVANGILETLASTGERLLIFLEGLSGVGKSTVLDSIKDDVREADCYIFDGYFSNLEKNIEKYWSLLVPVTTSELGHLERIGFDHSTKNSKWHTLPGMDQQEITDYLQDKENKTSLSSEDLVKYSLGIPNLADSMISDMSLTPEKAAIRAARYLGENFGELWGKAETHEELYKKYLQIPVAANIDDALYEASLSVKNVFDLLPEIIFRRKELVNKGDFEEEPFFIAPESAEIYNEMWNSNHGFHSIAIYSPDVNEANSARLKEIFPEAVNKFSSRANSSRFYLFGVSGSHKIDVEIVEQYGASNYTDEERYWKTWTDKKLEQFRRMELPIKPASSQNATFYFRRSDHFDVNREMTVRVGWMVESLLQQISVPYIVTNGFLEKSYAYVPQQQKIINL